MQDRKLKLDIRKMHCRSCEMLIEKSVSKVSGVKKVNANFRNKTAEVIFDPDRTGLGAIKSAIEQVGYEVGKEGDVSFFSKDVADYFELAAAGSVLFLAYIILKSFGWTTIGFGAGENPSLLGVLIIGLTAGVSSCMALIGGLVLGISARHTEIHPEATAMEKMRPHFFFNLGRLASYTLLGGVIGLIGSTIQFSSGVLGTMTAIIGFIMLVLGLKIINIFPILSSVNLTLPSFISRYLGLNKDAKEYSHKGSFITGALTFFVPCGFTQAMQLYAVSTGSFLWGASIMFFFALGTMPGLLGIGGLTSIVKGEFGRYFFKFVGLLVIIFSFLNIQSGFTLAGYDLSLPKINVNSGGNYDAETVPIENGKQVIIMDQLARGYSPNKFVIKKGIPVVWKINSRDSYTCASYFSVPSLGVSGPLQPGENVLEFTPTQTGNMVFSCSMGMYRGVINIVD